MEIKEDIIPLIIVHEGAQEYLKLAIDSASKYNKKVFLIGDGSNKNFCDNWYSSELLKSELYLKFKSVYKHMSSNSYEFELLCFKRYFSLYEFVKKKEIKKFIMLDSDLLTYSNLSDKRIIDFSNIDLSLSICKNQENYRWSASPHCSFWKLETLEKFILYCIDVYENNIDVLEEKYKYHELNNIPGGICDMTLLYLFIKNNEFKFLNTAINSNGSVFDHKLSTTENYVNDEYCFNRILKMKRIIFKDGSPYFLTQDKEMIKAITLHAQGGSKKYMKSLYRCRNNKLYYYKETIVNKLKRG